MYRIYTRIGDKGTTALYGGNRIEKDHTHVKAYGTVDELISQPGACYVTTRDVGLWESLHHIQQVLFVLGAELAGDARGLAHLSRTIDEKEITVLERLIDRDMIESDPLKQFVIPERNLASARPHVACTQSRRLERLLTAMDRVHPLRDAFRRYSNRPPDVLFPMARIEETRPDTCT